jgi:hypothetical protein
MTIKGFELVKLGDKVFISEPYNLWKPRNAGPNDKPNKFSYVWFNGEQGKKLQGQIMQMSKDEFRRRASAPAPQPEQNAWDDDVFGGGSSSSDDGLPF